LAKAAFVREFFAGLRKQADRRTAIWRAIAKSVHATAPAMRAIWGGERSGF
jgi:hypothetical protein